MQSYVTGEVIRGLREKRRLTQRDLAQRLNVSDKTISKWEDVYKRQRYGWCRCPP